MPYYMGDPGFFSFLGKIGKTIGGAALSVIPGGGMVRTALGTLTRGRRLLPAAAGVGAVGGLARIPAGILSRIPRGGKMAIGAGAAAAAGFGAAQLLGPGARRRGRRINVTNVRALRRAIRRAHGFARLARRVLSFTSPRPPRGRMFFRRKGKGVSRKVC